VVQRVTRIAVGPETMWLACVTAGIERVPASLDIRVFTWIRSSIREEREWE
jgi:hypothetical protein